jgi:hypothetical protein
MLIITTLNAIHVRRGEKGEMKGRGERGEGRGERSVGCKK